MNARLPDQRPALPDDWINSLFDRLEAAYGSRWQNMWGNSSLQNVKDLWAEKLAGFFDNPKAIGYALNALDEHPFPPTLPEFLALCRKAPRPELQALPAPAANPEKVKEFSNDAVKVTTVCKDMHGWAKRPKSQIALNAVIELAKKGERDFIEYLEALRESGRVFGDSLKNRWDGTAW